MSRDPKQIFVCNSVTREEISYECKNFVESCGWSCVDGRDVAIDDERLTDELCQQYANAIGEQCDSEDLQSENDENAVHLLLEAMGYRQPDDDFDEKAELVADIQRTEEELKQKRARLMRIEATEKP